MKAKSIRFNQRGVGDCRLAKGHETYGLFFESNQEARKLANDVFLVFHDEMNRPNVRLTGRNTTRTMGTANYYTGQIRLHNKGANVGCLLHELGHLFKITRFGSSHSREFKMSQTKLLKWFKKNRDNYIARSEKVSVDADTRYSSMDDLLGKVIDGVNNHNPNKIAVGDRIWWNQKKYGRIEGTVVRMNWKTATIKNVKGYDLPLGVYFRVSPKLLNKVNALPEIKPVKLMKPEPIEPKVEPKVEDTEEENIEFIHGLMDGLAKYAVWETVSMKGIVKCLWVNGIKNTDDNRKIAVDYVQALGLKIR